MRKPSLRILSGEVESVPITELWTSQAHALKHYTKGRKQERVALLFLNSMFCQMLLINHNTLFSWVQTQPQNPSQHRTLGNHHQPMGIFKKLFIYLFIYLWLCWVFVSVRVLSLVVASGGHSSSRCTGLSLLRPLLLRSTGSRRAGSVIVAHGLSCSAACGIFPDQGSNPCPLHWQADSQPLRHQGSPTNGNWYNVKPIGQPGMAVYFFPELGSFNG